MAAKGGWVDWANRVDIGPLTGNGVYKGRAHKITVLLRTESTPMWGTSNKPPHIAIWLGSGARKPEQYVSMDAPAYALSGGSVLKPGNGNNEAGINIQVAVMGVANATGYWTQEKTNQLAGWLVKICRNKAIPANAPYAFRATSTSPDIARLSWIDYSIANGILGIQHSARDEGRWGPGVIPMKMLADALRLAGETESAQAPPNTSYPGYEPPKEPGVGESPEDVNGADDEATDPLVDFDMSTKPFRFNPPLHQNLLPRRMDFGSNDHDSFMRTVYLDETGYVAGTDATPLQTFRLGRIIQHDRAAGLAAVNESRYGFRFLYNPASVTTSASRSDSVVIDPQSAIGAVVSGIDQNFQTVRFKVLLNRTADVGAGSSLSPDQYLPNIQSEDVEGIMTYGTHWDLEILYRVCNGIFNLDDRGRSADIGVIVPSNTRLILGPGVNHFGFVESIRYVDQLFSPNMIPILTDVEIGFRRHLDMQPSDLASFNESLIAAGISGDKTGTSDDPGSDGQGPGTSDPNGMDALAMFNKFGLSAGWTYGSKDPWNRENKGGERHASWDVRAPNGTPLLAGVNGTVLGCNGNVSNDDPHYSGAPSNWVSIRTTCDGKPACVYYQHLSPGLNVKVGDKVTPSTYIGRTGYSGNVRPAGPGGAHLHFSARWTHNTDNYPKNDSMVIYPPSLPITNP